LVLTVHCVGKALGLFKFLERGWGGGCYNTYNCHVSLSIGMCCFGLKRGVNFDHFGLK